MLITCDLWDYDLPMHPTIAEYGGQYQNRNVWWWAQWALFRLILVGGIGWGMYSLAVWAGKHVG